MDKLEGREDREKVVQWSRRSSKGVENAGGWVDRNWRMREEGEMNVSILPSLVDRKAMPNSPQQQGLLPTSQLFLRGESINLMGWMPAPG